MERDVRIGISKAGQHRPEGLCFVLATLQAAGVGAKLGDERKIAVSNPGRGEGRSWGREGVET